MSGMKKYVSTGLLALLTTAYLTSSCSRDDFSGSIIEAKKQAFSDIFVKTYGQPDPQQTWGFGSSSTRGWGFGSANAWALTRAITVHGDPYDEFNFPTDAELSKAFPSAPPTGSEEVSNLWEIHKNDTYGDYNTPVYNLYDVFNVIITKDYNLKVEQAGTVYLGGYIDNSGNPQGAPTKVIDGEYQCYNVYVNLPNKTDELTIRRIGDTMFNLYVIRGTVNLESDFGAMVGSVCVGSNAVLNDNRTSTSSGKNGHEVKYFCRGEYNATNTTGFDIGNDSRFYNEGTFTVTGPLSYSAGAGNTSYLINFGSGELTAPSMTMNSTCHFYTAGQVNIDGLTKVTQSGIVWINDGHYTTGSMEFGAGNATFYNYCQLKVDGNCKFRDGAFNMMNSSYAEFGTIQVNNFHVNLYNNSGFNVLNGGKFGQNGAGINQGFFAVNNASAYIRLDGDVYIPRHKNYSFQVSGANLTLAYSSGLKFYETVTLPSGNDICAHDYDKITYSTETTEDLPEMHLWNLNDVTKIVTGDDFGQVTVTPKYYPECGATWNVPGGGDDPSGSYENIDVQEIIDGRIFCEDLGSAQATDIDYNDVVFDAQTYLTHTFRVPYTTGTDGKKVYDLSSKTLVSSTYNKTDINLLAAGGTIDISVAEEDVNSMMAIGKTTMANTYVAGVSPNQSGYTNFDNGISPVKFTVSNPNYEQLINIPIYVRYDQEVSELTAYVGDTPQKLCAPMGSPWSDERVEMNTAYPGFAAWAGNRLLPEPWYGKVVGNLYNVKFVSNSIENQKGGTITDWESEGGAIIVSGKGKSENESERKFITITLDKPLAVGDQIAITGYRNRPDNAVGSLYFLFDNNYVIADEQVYNNAAYGSEANTFIWTVDENTEGCNSFKLSRNKTGTNVYITGITIVSGLGPQRTATATGSGAGTGGTGGTGGSGTGGSTGEPSFGAITGTTVYSGKTTLSSGSALNIDYADFNGAISGDIYIYGTGTGSVEVNGAPTEDVTSGAASAPGFNFTRGFGFTRSAETPVVKKCTLGPKQLHGYNVGITGNNFTVYKVSCDANLPAVSQPTGNVLVSSASGIEMNWAQGGQQHISADKLTGIGDGTIIRVAGVGYADKTDATTNTSWQVELDVESPWTIIDNKSYQSADVDVETGAVTVVFELSGEQAAALRNSQLVVQGVNFILKYVTIDNSNVTPSGGGGGGNATATINLLTSNTSLTGGVVAIVSDQPTAKSYASRIVAGTSKLVAKIQVNSNDYWYFKLGSRGNTGDGIMSKKEGSNNNGSEYTFETDINSDMLESIQSNANDSWWSGGMFGAQGDKVTLKELKLTNCLPAE